MGDCLRIALLTHSVNPRGGVMHTLELAQALHARGHRVTVMAPATERQQLFRRVPFDVELVRVPEQRMSTREMVRSRIDAHVDHLLARSAGIAFDILHAQDGIGANALATLDAGGSIDGFVATVHHVDRFEDAEVNHLQRHAIVSAGLVLCVSRLWQQNLWRDYGVAAQLVHNGVDLQRFSPGSTDHDLDVTHRLGLRRGAPLIVSVGGIEERKNTLMLLRAFLHLRETHPDAQWIIAGGASLLDHSRYAERFRAELAASGLAVGRSGAIHMTGPLDDADLPALLRLADAVAFASLREGFGLITLEALACGTPVVVSRIAPFTEYLRNEVVWTEPTDAESIATALRRACAMPHFAPPAVCERFSWNACAVQHEAHYLAFLAARERRATGTDS